MPRGDDAALVAALESIARPLTGSSDDDDELVGLVGEARFVLGGEATHGTHEL